MHPLLVSAVASTAGNFLDRWARGAGAPPVAAEQAFDTALNGATAAVRSAPTAAERLQSLAARMHAQLFDAPEIRAVLDACDPGKPTTIEVLPDGTVLTSTPGRDPKPILLSPETAALARDFAALSGTSRGLATAAGLKPAALVR